MSRKLNYTEYVWMLRRRYDGKFYKQSYQSRIGVDWTCLDNAFAAKDLESLTLALASPDSGIKTKDFSKYEVLRVVKEITMDDSTDMVDWARTATWQREMYHQISEYRLNYVLARKFAEFWQDPDTYLRSGKHSIILRADIEEYKSYIRELTSDECMWVWAKLKPPVYFDFVEVFTKVLKKQFGNNPNIKADSGNMFSVKFLEDAMTVKLAFPFQLEIIDFKQIYDNAARKF